MDVPREGAAKKRLIRRIGIAAVLLTAAGGVTLSLSPTVRQKFRHSWRPMQKSSGQLVSVLAESQ